MRNLEAFMLLFLYHEITAMYFDAAVLFTYFKNKRDEYNPPLDL